MLTECGARGSFAVHAATSTACGRTTALPSRDISTVFFEPRAMGRISAQFSSTLIPFAFMGKRIDHFSGQSSNGIASMGTRFSVRATAYERHFRCRASAHSSIFGTSSRSSYERACWLEIFVSNFFLVLHGSYQVKTVPYCTYMITFTKPLYIKRPQAKTVPYHIYMITSMHKPLECIKRPQVKQVPYCNYSSRVETVQYIRCYLCLFSLPALRSTLPA